MKSVTTRRFRELYGTLTPEVQRRARQSYRLFRNNSNHPGLQFKKVNEALNIWSVRVGLAHRALGRMNGAEIVWFWIGTHKEYDRLT